MSYSISESTQQTLSVGDRSLCDAGIPNQIVASGVDALLSRVATDYLDLMDEAKENPGIISDYKSSLFDYYSGQTLSPETVKDILEAQKIAPNCNVITKTLPSKGKISVFSEKNKGFDENQTLCNSRVHVRLNIKAKSIKEQDSLDLLLSQLSKKILSLGYGNEGTFDIRLEKGCLALEANSWKRHFDGNIFKTSITVCYSNKTNWSTQIFDSIQESDDGKPANHGFLYDALKVFHRSPVPADLEGEELNADDYRLFIRYTDFYTRDDVALVPSKMEEEKRNIPNNLFAKGDVVEVKIPNLLPNHKTSALNIEFDSFLNSDSLHLRINQFVDSQSIENALANHSSALSTLSQPDFTSPTLPKYDFSQFLTPLATLDSYSTPNDTKGNELLAQCVQELPQDQSKTSPPCAVM